MSQLSPPPVSLLDLYHGDRVLPLYSTAVTVVGGQAGHGRSSGHATSSDGVLDIQLRLPAELGGPGGGTNPEQLFAAGYAACFHGALTLVATKQKTRLPNDLTVTVTVTFGRDPSDGLFLLSADIGVHLPGIETELAEALITETEKICPYAKMGRQGIKQTVKLTV